MLRIHGLGLFVCLCAMPIVAEGQLRSLGGGQSGGGQMSSFGGSSGGFGSGSAGGGNNGGSMFGNSGGGMFGNAMGGNTGVGNTGAGGGLGGGGIQTGLGIGGIALPVGENAFVGLGNPNGGFVGDRRIGSGMLGGFNSGRGGFGGRFGSFGGRRGRDSDNRWNDGGEEVRQSIRPTMKLGFEVDGPVSTVTGQEFQERFARIAAREPELAGITYQADGAGRVVLTGTVPDEDARGLAIALFRLEPGVRDVVDQMTIAGAERVEDGG